MQNVPSKSLDSATEISPRHDGVALDLDDLLSFQELDELVRLAKSIYNTGAAFVSIMGRSYQWFLSEKDVSMRMSPIQGSICRRIVHERGECIIGDTRLDPDLVKNPFVTDTHAVRFYAGVPIRVVRPDNGKVIKGTFCITDVKPRDPEEFNAQKLEMLASLAGAIIEARISKAIAVETLERQVSAMEQLDRNERLFSSVERMADMGSWRYDLNTKELEWSHGVYAIHGMNPLEKLPIGDSLRFYPPRERKKVEQIWVRAVEHGEAFDLELDFRTISGSKKRVRVVGEVEYRGKTPCAVIGLMSDVTQQHAMQKALRLEAMTDALTGIPNRAGFHMAIADKLSDAGAPDRVALLVVDLDGFKAVNDKAGHLAGDRALVKCAHIIRDIAESYGFAARYGGDEFVVILSGRNVRGKSKEIAARITKELRFEVENTGKSDDRLWLGATVGIAYNADDDAVHDIIHRADIAMYEAKRARPGTVNIASGQKDAA